MKRNSATFVTEEMHIKCTLKYYHKAVKITKMKYIHYGSIGKELEVSYTAGGNVNRRIILENTLAKVKLNLPCNPVIGLLRIYPELLRVLLALQINLLCVS